MGSKRWSVGTAAAAGLLVGLAVAGAAPGAGPDPVDAQASRLVARSVLPASTVRAGSPPSGAFLGPVDRANAAANGVSGSEEGPLFDAQPVQGISALVPDGAGTWFAMSDNGFGSRVNSADWQLVVNRMDPSLDGAAEPEVLESFVLSDPDAHVSWTIACDPTVGEPLPPFDFNSLPDERPAACGDSEDDRALTGFDFDIESMQLGADGSFWFGDEFGPYLLHTDRDGRLLEPPIEVPGVRAPENARLAGGELPTAGTSRGFEGMAISPDRTMLHPLFEGAVGEDDPQTLRMLSFDIEARTFTDDVHKLRLEMPGGKVDPTSLVLADGSAAYPDAVAPSGTGGQAIGELTAINDHQFLLVERDGGGDGPVAPRFKKVFLLDLDGAESRDGYLSKQLLVDLMAVPDPGQLGGDGDFFRFPFNTIESVHPVDPFTVVLVDDNNYPFSNGRSRSQSADRAGPLSPDDNEFILVRLGTPLDVDDAVLRLPN